MRHQPLYRFQLSATTRFVAIFTRRGQARSDFLAQPSILVDLHGMVLDELGARSRQHLRALKKHQSN